MDLHQLFGSNRRITWALMHRFDRLSIQSSVYFQSYNQGVLGSGQHRTMFSKLDPTGIQQDCIGMTPLHILAWLSVHNLELYHVIVQIYPTNLITEDRWGATPLLYAFWGAALSIALPWPRIQLDNDHVETLGRCDTPKESIENLLFVKQMHFPDRQLIGNICLTNLYSLHNSILVDHQIRKGCDFLSCAACQSMWSENVFP